MSEVSSFHKLLDTATRCNLPDVDWGCATAMNDLIQEEKISAKDAIAAISKKIRSINSRTAYYALLVLDSCVKNCGTLIHDEIGTKSFMDLFCATIDDCNDKEVKTKALDLLQVWAFAFQNIPKYRAIKDSIDLMRKRRYTFPAFKINEVMFIAPTLADGVVHCHRCQIQFDALNDQHNCRACGQVFCPYCSNIPDFGPWLWVMGVCERCCQEKRPPDLLSQTTSLPIRSLSSSSAQPTQTVRVSVHIKPELRNVGQVEVKIPNESRVDVANRAFLESSIDANSSEHEARKSLRRSLSSRTVAEQQSRCEICLDGEKKVAFLCGHRTCSQCAKKIKTCHICRKPITHRITLY